MVAARVGGSGAGRPFRQAWPYAPLQPLAQSICSARRVVLQGMQGELKHASAAVVFCFSVNFLMHSLHARISV